MNIFTYITNANPLIVAELIDWVGKSREYLDLFYEGQIERAQGTEFGDCIAKVSYITERAIEEGVLFRGVRDRNGLQAGAIIQEDSGNIYLYERYREYLYLDAITNAPWNCLKNRPLATKGSATSLFEEIIKESIALGYNGVVKTLAIPRAKRFYQQIGFAENPDGSGEMVLTEEAALGFLEVQQRRRDEQG